MRAITKTLTPLLALALVLPGVAAAKPRAVLAPPGDSAVSQYVEVVPTASGATPSQAPTAANGSATGGGQAGGVQSRALTPSQQARLDALGADGRTLAAVVDATSPPPAPDSAAAASRGAGAENASGAYSSGAGSASGAHSAGNASGALTAARAVEDGAGGLLSGARPRSTASLIADTALGGGSDGLGIVLAAIALVGALGVVARAVRRRRTGS
jgi:hypothetical protein